MTSPEKLATPETVRKALQRAYSLGQTYWQQADSESFSQNRKADETAAKFQALVEETVACVLATQRQGEGEPFTDAEIKDFTSMIWGAPCHGKDLALVAVVVKAMEQMNPGERPKDPARGGRLLDWDSLPMDLLEQGAQPMLDKLTATSQGVAVAQPDAPPAIKNKGVAFRDWETHPLYKSATAMGHFDAGWMRCLAATTSKD